MADKLIENAIENDTKGLLLPVKTVTIQEGRMNRKSPWRGTLKTTTFYNTRQEKNGSI